MVSVQTALALLMLLAAGPVAACGPDSDCTIGSRSYRIATPHGVGPYGAVLFLHGYKGSAAAEMGNDALRDVARRLGVALIAAQSAGDDWEIRGAPHADFADDAVELAYVDHLLADVTARFPVDPGRILVAGFSAGGMMAWTLACRRGDRFAGFLAVSGTFWEPLPDHCPTLPVNLLHIHGTADTVVPLAGRPIADARQGSVPAAFALFARDGGYTEPVAAIDPPAGLDCAGRATPAGAELLLCLHAGGHTIDVGWIGWAWQRFVGRR